MLAYLSVAAGCTPLVIDCFADVDTQQIALQLIKVPSLGLVDIRPAVEWLTDQYAVTHIVYGSGFEACVDSLQYLEDHFVLLGNPVALFRNFQDKRNFFRQLAVLSIPYPETVFTSPADEAGWLLKPKRGEGGINISCYQARDEINHDDYYWQRYLPGESGSVLFLSSLGRLEVLGFNRQWTTVNNHRQSFVFAGIANYLDISAENRALLVGWLRKLLLVYPLQGLASLDFILHEGRCYVLEINARIPASAQLYGSLVFKRHLQACLGMVAYEEVELAQPMAYHIVYAQNQVCIPKDMKWPAWVVDQPELGVIVGKGQPICSIIATGKTRRQVAKRLGYRREIVENFLKQVVKNMQYQASVNKLTQPLVQYLLDNADQLRLGVETLDNGCTIIDAGIKVLGGLEAGRIITEICMGGMGTVSISQSSYTENWPLTINVHASNPVLACLGSQYAGWSLSHGKYYALGSGPARALATKVKDGAVEPVEELYKELEYRDSAEQTVLVIENDGLPPVEIVDKVAAACGVAANHLVIIVTPTSSLAGGVQVVGRVLEVAMHKAHALHFPLENIVDGSGSAPICPPHPNFVKAMGRTNDAILFAGQVHLFVKGSDEAAEKLAKELPSSTSKDYGKPFADIFKAYEYDFFKVDAMLFSPASVIVTAVESGKSFRAGKLDNALLDQSFGL